MSSVGCQQAKSLGSAVEFVATPSIVARGIRLGRAREIHAWHLMFTRYTTEADVAGLFGVRKMKIMLVQMKWA